QLKPGSHITRNWKLFVNQVSLLSIQAAKSRFTKAVMPFAEQIARQHSVHLLAGRYTYISLKSSIYG
ncbi:hypothetical protein, partial [uncultured Shewanella sp.]|uniref:hypothetical protein n=1 Tax=uncultured Shewanella sp. TaxID=173975 RepID=UPI002638BBAB